MLRTEREGWAARHHVFLSTICRIVKAYEEINIIAASIHINLSKFSDEWGKVTNEANVAK